MSTIMKYDLLLLDLDTYFSLWQVKMRAILSYSDRDLDDALDGFGKDDIRTWTDEERRNDRKVLAHIHLHLSNNILQAWAGPRGFQGYSLNTHVFGDL
jgi:hypothetical protein